MEEFIKQHFTYPLHGKKLLWTDNIRIFCDGGYGKFGYIPKIYESSGDPYWNMISFTIYWLGREIIFSFGKDIKGLYTR